MTKGAWTSSRLDALGRTYRAEHLHWLGNQIFNSRTFDTHATNRDATGES